MDGGAYCTLTPGRPVARRDPRRWALSLPECPHSGACDANQHAAQRRVPRLRRAAGPVRVRDAPQPDRRRARDQPARDPPAERLHARRHDPDRPGPARERGRRGGARTSGRSIRVRTPPQPPRVRARAPQRRARRRPRRSRRRTGNRRCGPGARERPAAIGLALAWHGAGFTGFGRGEAGVGRLARADGRWPDPDPDCVHRDGPGDQDDLPAACRRGARRPDRGRRDRGPGHGVRARFGPDGRLADGHGRRRAADPGGRSAADRGRSGRPVARSRRPIAISPGDTARSGSISASSPIPASASMTRRIAVTPTRRSAGRPASPRSRSTSIPARSTSATSSPPTTSATSSIPSSPRARSRAARSRPWATPRSRRSSCATGATSTTAWRPTSSRPLSTRRGSPRSWSRRRTRACPTAPRVSGSCRWTSGRRRSSPRSPTRPASGSTSLPASPERILAALAGVAAVAPLPAGASEPAGVTTYSFTVNAERVDLDVPGMRRLLDVLREDLGLTGTKEGCGEGECGACTVLLDGAPVDACLVPVCQVDGASVATVEGLAPRPRDGRGRVASDARCPPERVPRDRRRAMRDLHAGDADGRARLPRCRWRPRRRRDPRGHRGQPLSLHRATPRSSKRSRWRRAGRPEPAHEPGARSDPGADQRQGPAPGRTRGRQDDAAEAPTPSTARVHADASWPSASGSSHRSSSSSPAGCVATARVPVASSAAAERCRSSRPCRARKRSLRRTRAWPRLLPARSPAART